MDVVQPQSSDSNCTVVKSPVSQRFCEQILTLPLPPSGELDYMGNPILPAELKHTFQKLTASMWYAENRWLARAPLHVQINVILRFAHYRIPTMKLELQMIIDTLFQYLCTHDEQNAEQCTRLFNLSPHTYSGILHRACKSSELSADMLCRVIRTVLENTWRLILQEYLIFTRSHVVMLYERLTTLFITWSSPGGSKAFEALVTTVSSTFRPYRNTRQPIQARAYRVTCIRRIHRVLITTIFNNLCCRGHYKDADTLFGHNRVHLAPLLRQWLPSLDAEDVAKMWSECIHIRAYCQDKVCKLDYLMTECPVLWEQCYLSVDEDMRALTTCSSSKIIHHLCKCVSRTGKTITQLLIQFSVKTQKRFILEFMRWTCSYVQDVRNGITDIDITAVQDEIERVTETTDGGGGGGGDGDGDGDGDNDGGSGGSGGMVETDGVHMSAAETYSQLTSFFERYARTALRKTHAPMYLLRYYSVCKYNRTALFLSVCPAWTFTEKHLTKWFELYPTVPVHAFHHLTNHVSRHLDQHQPEMPAHHEQEPSNSGSETMYSNDMTTLRVCQVLRQYNKQLHLLLKQPLDWKVGIEPQNLFTVIHTLSRFISTHGALLNLYNVSGIHRLVRSLLVAFHMQTRTKRVDLKPGQGPTHQHDTHTEEYSNSDDCCAICYNSVDAPLQQLQCGHVFHTECMVQTVQLAVSGNTPSSTSNPNHVCKCPYCIQPVQTDPETVPHTPPTMEQKEENDVHDGIPQPLETPSIDYDHLHQWWNTHGT